MPYPKQKEYICVYDMNHPQSDFGNNGLFVLEPTACEITEELNGTYELHLEHPIDSLGKWKSLINNNIIKADGQLFRIVKRKVKMASNGRKAISVDCLHIFYDLNHKVLRNWTVHDRPDWMLHHIMNNDEHAGDYQINDGSPIYAYTWHMGRVINKKPDGSTEEMNGDDNRVAGDASYKDSSVVSAIMGSNSNALTNIFDVEIYRDNFYFSLGVQRENSKTNAFTIQYGIDMIDIEQTTDYSNFCSKLFARDNFGSETYPQWGSSIPARIPYDYVKSATFQYSENNPQRFARDAWSYFRQMNFPRVSYKVNYADLSNAPMYDDFRMIKNCNVGDRGFVVNPELGIDIASNDPAYQVKVVKKTKNVLKGETSSIELGTLSNSFLRQGNYNNLFSGVSGQDTFFTLTNI